jgi:hypothetical protein
MNLITYIYLVFLALLTPLSETEAAGLQQWDPRAATPAIPGSTIFALSPNLRSVSLPPDAIRLLSQTFIVAGSYLDGIDLNNKAALVQRLTDGECRSSEPCGDGQTLRIGLAAAQSFVDNYKIARHYPNDSSGLSATLIWNKEDNQFILAIRRAERQAAATSDEVSKDRNAMRQAMTGFAFAQVAAARDLVNQLRKDIPGFSTSKVILTGMDLGGHVCLILNELFPGQFGLLFVSQPPPYFVGSEAGVAASAPR